MKWKNGTMLNRKGQETTGRVHRLYADLEHKAVLWHAFFRYQSLGMFRSRAVARHEVEEAFKRRTAPV